MQSERPQQSSQDQPSFEPTQQQQDPSSDSSSSPQRPRSTSASKTATPEREASVPLVITPIAGQIPADPTPPEEPVETPKNGATEPLTPEQLDRAKSIVLDLLGWGVPPDYLVEAGVSSGAIFKIFTDLRLRLPSNLDGTR
ncbi:hypothetical protein C8J56DRAFT_935149 [Mycena floridula]|nr:hypothetical protein C8J56DRAFT_935149 [Mycena floridula]